MNRTIVYQPTQQTEIGGPLTQSAYELGAHVDHVVTSPPMYPVLRMRLAHFWNWNEQHKVFIPERCLHGCPVCILPTPPQSD